MTTEDEDSKILYAKKDFCYPYGLGFESDGRLISLPDRNRLTMTVKEFNEIWSKLSVAEEKYFSEFK